MTNDVWIIYQTAEYMDGSKEQFISAVYGERDEAEKSLDRREEWSTRNRRRRHRDGEKEVKKSSWDIQRWFVI